MCSAGDERPPERPGDSDGQEPEEPSQDAPEGDAPEERRAARGGAARAAPSSPRPERAEEAPSSPSTPSTARAARSGARWRRSRPRRPTRRRSPGTAPTTRSTSRAPGCATAFASPTWPGSASSARGGGLRDRLGRGDGEKRRWLRWVLIGVCGWLLLSFIAFAVSAQIQKGKLDDSAKEALEGGPDLLGRAEHPHPRRRPSRRPPGQRHGHRGPGAAARGHDHGPARLADLVPQALDPPRHLRRDPGLRLAEDQRLARLQHEQPRRQPRLDDPNRRELPRDRHQPHRDHRLRRLRGLHQHPGRDRGGRPGQQERVAKCEQAAWWSAATSTGARTRAASRSSCRPGSTPWRATRRWPSPGSARTSATPPRTTPTAPPASRSSSTGSRAG